MNEFLKSLAPLLGTAIAGPLGGVAASFIADKLGLSESTVEVVSDVLNNGKMTAEQVSAVKLAEIDFKRFLESNKIDMEKIAADNTKSAREMQIVTKSAFPAILSTFITVGFFGILGWMLYDDSITNSEPILIMLGSLGAAFGAVCNYWLGSSKSSGEYRQLLAQK